MQAPQAPGLQYALPLEEYTIPQLWAHLRQSCSYEERRRQVKPPTSPFVATICAGARRNTRRRPVGTPRASCCNEMKENFRRGPRCQVPELEEFSSDRAALAYKKLVQFGLGQHKRV